MYQHEHQQCYETLPHDEPSCAATTFLRQATFLYPCTTLMSRPPGAMQQPGRLCVHSRVSRVRISAYLYMMTFGFLCRLNDTDFPMHHPIPHAASASKRTIGEEAKQ